MNYPPVPIICIDGPSASGKGTVAKELADRLGFHYLDSGSLYRIVAWAARKARVATDDVSGLLQIIADVQPRYEKHGAIWVNGQNIQDSIRGEHIGFDASTLARYPEVRVALLETQRAFAKPPGLVTDGRDMGSVVFPHATLKVFLMADTEERAQRRYKQLILQGESANLAVIRSDLEKRDEQDQKRFCAPLHVSQDARILDGTHLSIEEVVETILQWWLMLQPCL